MTVDPTAASENGNEFLTERDLAERWKVSIKLTQKMRYHGGGPAFVHIGRVVRYHINDVREYEAQRRRETTSDVRGHH